ncbi:MAG: prenyltransferase [Chloroflexota bacterium]|jgi:1,4-dihydroxy-2-naphthoate octaprenyltransferase
MNVKMWVKALQVIPRIERDEWRRLDVISKWLISTRAAVLIMTFISAAIAGLLAVRAGEFDGLRWLMLVIGLLFAHATNNLLNDLTDYSRGVDTDNYYRTQYGPQPLEQGLWSRKTHLLYTAVTGLIALAAGMYLVTINGWLAFWLLLAGAVFVLFYTFPLKYVGLGEIAVLIVWGPLMIGGGYFVITGRWDWYVALASLAYALGPTTVIFGKHIDKLKQDQEKGIRTLPVILGETASRYTVLGMIALQYLSVITLVIAGYFSPVMLIVLFAWYYLPPVLKVFLRPRPSEKPSDERLAASWPLYFVASAFYQNRSYGLLLLVGLIVQLFMP